VSDRQAITITRVYDAPREAVWRAWTEPEELAAWWGKRGWNTPVESVELDVRPGGTFKLDSIHDETGESMPLNAIFVEVDPPTRLTFGRMDRSDESVVTFTDLGDGRTEMRFEATVDMSEEVRERAIAGLGSAFDRLGAWLSA
jgi:uncharacterized protein YndB with AHSA1/START domain